MVRKIKDPKKTSYFNRKLKELKENANTNECLFKDEGNCEEKIIKAHSIQNNKFLKKIARNGDVFYIHSYITNEDNLKFDFCKEGRNKFSTFRGFCKKHDKTIFSPIEDCDYSNSSEKNFLFAFRALAKEIYHVKENVSLFEKVREEALKNFKIELFPLITTNYNNAKTNLVTHLKDIDEFKNGIKLKKYDSLYTKVIIFDKEYPIVSNCSFIPYFSTDFNRILNKEYQEIQDGKINPLIFLNVFPEQGKTYVLISCFKKYKEMLENFFESLNENNINENNIKERISMLILTYAGNTGYSPDYIANKFSEQEKELMVEIYTAPLLHPLNIKKIYINLFKD